MAAPLTLVTGPQPLAGQLVTLLCGSLLAPLTFWLTRDLLSPAPADRFAHRAGWLAGLLVATGGQAVLSSIVLMADIPALCWATLAAWLTVRLVQQPPRARPLAWAALGLALGLAIITRWIFILLAPALAGYLLARRYWRLYPRWMPLAAFLTASAVLIPQLWLSAYKPAGLLHSWLLGWTPANFLRRSFTTLDGQFDYLLPNALFYAQPAFHPAYLFPLFGLAALAGGWLLWRTRRRAALLLLLGWTLPVYLFLAGIPYQNFRFGLTGWPPLAILAGCGLSWLWQQPPPRPAWLTRRWPALITTGVTAALLVTTLWSAIWLNAFLTTQDQAKQIARQVAGQLPPDAILLAFGLTLTLRHYTPLAVHELFYLDPASLQPLLHTDRPLYLLLDVATVNRQWQAKTPQRNYAWLHRHARLTPIATFPPYTLFQIRNSTSHPPTGSP